MLFLVTAIRACPSCIDRLRFIGGLVPVLPAYFNSEWSYAQACPRWLFVVSWIDGSLVGPVDIVTRVLA